MSRVSRGWRWVGLSMAIPALLVCVGLAGFLALGPGVTPARAAAPEAERLAALAAPIATQPSGPGEKPDAPAWPELGMLPAGVELAAASDLSVTLRLNSARAYAGEVFEVQLDVANHGSTPALGATLVASLPASTTFVGLAGCGPTPSAAGQQLSWNLGLMPAGNTGSVTLRVRPDAAAAAGTLLNFTAQVTTADVADPAANNSAALPVTVSAPGVDLKVQQQSSAAMPGQPLEYQIVLFNHGSVTATSVTLTDTLPAGVTYMSAAGSPGWSVSPSGGQVIFTRADLPPGGASVTATIRVNVPSGLALGTQLHNTATASAAQPDQAPADNTSTLPGTLYAPRRDLRVTKILAAGEARASARLTYTLEVRNTGTLTMSGVVLTDTLAAGTTYVGATASPGVGAAVPGVGSVSWPVGTLAPGAAAWVTPTVQVGSGVVARSVLANSATATGAEADADLMNNTAIYSSTVYVPGQPDAAGTTLEDVTGSVAWVDATDGTRLALWGDDVAAGPVPLGFGFRLYGAPFTEVYVSSNGLLTFGEPSHEWLNRDVPGATRPNALIAPFWDDLQVCGAAAVYVEASGSAPNRTFTIEWAGVTPWREPTQPLTFEVVLHENGQIVFQYQALNGPTSSATVGIESSTGLVGQQYAFNTPGLAPGRALRFTQIGQLVWLPSISRR